MPHSCFHSYQNCKLLHHIFIKAQEQKWMKIEQCGKSKSEIWHIAVWEGIKISKFQNEFMTSSFVPKNEWKFLRISALASNKRSDQKNKGTLYHYLGSIWHNWIVNFFVGCMVFRPNRIVDRWTSLDY